MRPVNTSLLPFCEAVVGGVAGGVSFSAGAAAGVGMLGIAVDRSTAGLAADEVAFFAGLTAFLLALAALALAVPRLAGADFGFAVAVFAVLARPALPAPLVAGLSAGLLARAVPAFAVLAFAEPGVTVRAVVRLAAVFADGKIS